MKKEYIDFFWIISYIFCLLKISFFLSFFLSFIVYLFLLFLFLFKLFLCIIYFLYYFISFIFFLYIFKKVLHVFFYLFIYLFILFYLFGLSWKCLKKMVPPGFDPGTLTTSRWCDNQLHHETFVIFCVIFNLLWSSWNDTVVVFDCTFFFKSRNIFFFFVFFFC